MAVDGKQVIPPYFVPYLEKHNIYEVFYDLSMSLALDRPEDHVLYLRNKLIVLTKRKEVFKIIILGPDHIDKRGIAEIIGAELGINVISICDIISKDPNAEQDPKLLATRFKELMIKKKMANKGWILYDFPRDKLEARALQKNGINPTHVFQLVPSPDLYTPRDLWNEKAVDLKESDLKKMLDSYKARVLGLRNVFTNNIKEITIKGRKLEDVAKSCIMMTKQLSTKSGAPSLPRVVLIGPKGSQRKTIAKMLSERFNLVHIDMDALIEQGKIKDNDVGRKIKQLYDSNTRIFGKLVAALLEDRLLQYDCLNKGWVLTGFPRDRLDFELLDSFDTPPNRVIFLTKDSFASMERLKKRRINLYNGQVKSVDDIQKMGDDMLANHFIIHPSDDEKRLIFEHKIYSEGIQGMLDHCKQNCSIVDGEGTIEEVYDRVERVILNPAPVEKPRKGRDKDELRDDLYITKDNLDQDERKDQINIKKKVHTEFIPESEDLDLKFESCESIFPSVLTKEWSRTFDFIPDDEDERDPSLFEEISFKTEHEFVEAEVEEESLLQEEIQEE